jgi:Ca2+-binding RTX toxin-like protein
MTVFTKVLEMPLQTLQPDYVTIHGTDGADTLFAGNAKIGSIIYGHDGNDKISGGTGNDTLWGDSGGDILRNDGNDLISGGSGDDLVWAGGGNDTMFGDDGNDVLYGDGAGVNMSVAVNGSDTIYGGNGDDWLYGDTNHTLRAPPDSQRDWLDGGAGSDHVFGGRGNDTLIGGPGQDWMDGGPGADTFLFGIGDSATTNPDVIREFNSQEGDQIDLSALHSAQQTFAFIGQVTEHGFTPFKSGGAMFQVGFQDFGNGEIRIWVDTNGDADADASIQMENTAGQQQNPVAGWFHL